METFGDEIGDAAGTTGGGQGESLYGPGVPTAESYVDDAPVVEVSHDDDSGPPTEPIAGLVGQLTGETKPE